MTSTIQERWPIFERGKASSWPAPSTVQASAPGSTNDPALMKGEPSAVFIGSGFDAAKGAARSLESCTDDPDGLPNDGRFARNADHPVSR